MRFSVIGAVASPISRVLDLITRVSIEVTETSYCIHRSSRCLQDPRVVSHLAVMLCRDAIALCIERTFGVVHALDPLAMSKTKHDLCAMCMLSSLKASEDFELIKAQQTVAASMGRLADMQRPPRRSRKLVHAGRVRGSRLPTLLVAAFCDGQFSFCKGRG